MRKVLSIAALSVALAIPPVAIAATLSNAKGTTCSGVAVWHFVNNQTDGADPGSLTAYFSGGLTLTADPSAVNKNSQHFIVETTGDVTLLDAETDLPGRLVLSDVDCDAGKKDKK